ncbi:MAG: site-specific integrase [Bacillaceae bacterium]|nr:site-specific integrase [Bacillaceae bacterium]
MEYVTLPKRKDEINFDLEEENLSKFYTKQELKRFLDAIKNNSMVYAMFRLLSYTGARKGEICALHWSDINFKKKSIRLNKTLINADGKKMLQTSKTKASRRVISVDDETLSILKKWRKEQIEAYLKNSFSFERDDKQPVFTNLNHLTKKMDYCRLAYLNEQLNRIYKNNKHLPRITIHGFRHTHASLLFAAGASIKEVQDRLGHSDIKTTMNIYTHVTNEAKEKTADLFQEYMKL